MFKIEKEEGNNIFVKAEGKIDKEDYEKFIPVLEKLIEKHNKLNCVADLSQLDSATPEAMLEEIKLSYKYRNNIGRYAIVDAKPWLENTINIASSLNNGEVKVFEKNEDVRAWDWIKNTHA